MVVWSLYHASTEERDKPAQVRRSSLSSLASLCAIDRVMDLAISWSSEEDIKKKRIRKKRIQIAVDPRRSSS